VKVLRLACVCGRNLGDATNPAGGRWVDVTGRPGVDPVTYQPGAFRATHSWGCRCGRHHVIRADRIGKAWQDHADRPERVVTVVVGVDL
jgi:hypothetical protein